MMFENIEELLRCLDCRVVSANGERWLKWYRLCESWLVVERTRWAKKEKILYQGNDIRDAMQYLKQEVTNG